MRDLAERSPSLAVGGTDGVVKPEPGQGSTGRHSRGGGPGVAPEGAGRRAVTPGRGLLPRKRRRRRRAGSILGRAGVPAGSWGAARLPGRELRGAAWRGLHSPGATRARDARAGRAAERSRGVTSCQLQSCRCPAVLARQAASAPARPGRTCQARRCVLRGPNFLDCPSPSRRAARSPRPPGAGRQPALHSSRCPADPGRSPAAGDEGRGQPGPTPASHRAAPPTCAQPLSGFLLQSGSSG